MHEGAFMFKPTALTFALAAFAGLAGLPGAKAAPDITVSIKPIHSLVAGVTKGVSEPYLLIPGSASPHSYSMKPSDAQALENADIVFWIGEDMETFMTGPLEALAGDARVVELSEAPGLTLREVREGGDWEGHDHAHDGDHGDGHSHGDEHSDDHDHDHDHASDTAAKDDQDHDHSHGDEHSHDHEHGDEKASKAASKEEHGHDHDHGHDHAHGETDMHIWLDPENAKAMVAHVVAVLSEADPDNAAAYEQNGADMTARLDTLTAELRDILAPVKDEPFFVFHDAYQYFEARFDLSAAGSITINPATQPSAQRVAEISEKIGNAGATCIFAEPQFTPKLIEVVTEGTDAGSGVLDPLGAELADGPDMYFQLMRQNARAIADCLSARS